MTTSQELSETYNNNVKSLIISYNNAVAAILKQRGSNNIKQSYLNNLKQQYLANTLTLKTKYTADLEALSKPEVLPVAVAAVEEPIVVVAEEPVAVVVAEEPVTAEPVAVVADEPVVAEPVAVVAEEPVVEVVEEPVVAEDN